MCESGTLPGAIRTPVLKESSIRPFGILETIALFAGISK